MSRVRERKLLEQAAALGIQAVVLTSRENMRYFTGYTGEGAALIAPELRRIITDSRYTEQAARQAEGYGVADIGRATLAEFVLAGLREAGADTVGFEDNAMTVSEYRKLEGAGISFTGIGLIGERIRAVKEDSEIEIMRRAARLTDEGFAHILPFIRPGVSEYDIMAEMDYFFARRGASPAFPMIVASGPNGSMPHAETGPRQIQPGDMITMDFGATVDGYRSDMTRTVAVGEPDPTLREVYAIVLKAQLTALDAASAGMTGRELDAAARRIIGDAGYGPQFGHALGHGVGLAVHEQPRLSSKNEEPLEPGMIVTIEPGIYLPGLGGVRIEDTALITGDGCEPLLESAKELIVL